MTSTPARAFTLMEVLLTIVLVGVLAAIVWPSFFGALRSEQLPESASRMKSLVAMCRAQAMNGARRYRITFRPDGTIKVTRQLDPVYAPHVYVEVREFWASTPALLERVWVEAIQPMPDGPPPFEVEDELIEFEDFLAEPVPITDLETPHVLNFEPDGRSGSLAWLLRDPRGRGILMTLDGRLGRVTTEAAERVNSDQIMRPDPIEYAEDEEEASEKELLSEYLP